jgi:hypothetical protein
MGDNKKIRDGRYKAKVSGSERYEIDYLKKKFDVSGQQVAGAIRSVGNNRKKIEKYLNDLN